MTALSAKLDERLLTNVNDYSFDVKNSQQVYYGGLAGLEKSSGHIVPLSESAGLGYIGRTNANILGDTSASPIKDVEINLGAYIKKNIVVAGYTSAAKNWELVYAGTDNPDEDLTLTRPSADAQPVGLTVQYVSSGYGDVLFFGGLLASIISLCSGKGRELVNLGRFPLDSADGDLFTGLPLYGRGKIVDFFGFCDGDGAGASATSDINLELGGTNLTGGVITCALADAQTQGKKVSGTSITAANEFSDGDTLDGEIVSSTAFTAGLINLFIVIDRLAA